jgi:hypothetical protein
MVSPGQGSNNKEDTIDIVVTRNRKTAERVQIQPLDSFGDVKPPTHAEIDLQLAVEDNSD